MNKLKKIAALCGVFAIALGLAASAHAAVPTEISDITTNADTVWTTVKGIIAGVVGFVVLVAFVKRVRKS